MAVHSSPDIIEQSVEKLNLWLRDMGSELGEDRSAAYRALRAVLHVLRDRLTVDEAAQLAAQLPLLVRGIFYEGWDPSRTPARYRDAREFLDRVAREAQLAGDTEASYAVAATARVLSAHVSRGEFDDLLGVLPGDVRALFAEALQEDGLSRCPSRSGRRGCVTPTRPRRSGSSSPPRSSRCRSPT